jgi:hypothetical protein
VKRVAGLAVNKRVSGSGESNKDEQRQEQAHIPGVDDRRRLTVERFVGLDWSGRVDAAGQRRHIWAGVWTRSASEKVSIRLESGRTREEVAEWLIALAQETPRMVVGIDLCFSYPAWFLRELGCADLFAFWRLVASGKGEQWLHASCDDRRFWGKPHKRPAAFCGEGFRTMFRHADWDNKIAQALEGGDPVRAAKMKGITPKSPFQIGGSGSVGTGSLRGIPVLLRLWNAGFRVWPVEDAALSVNETTPQPLLVEIYTRLMTGAVAKRNAAARKVYLAKRRREDPLFAAVGSGVRRKAEGSEDAFDALLTTLEMARYGEEFASLRATADAELRLEGNTWRPGVS